MEGLEGTWGPAENYVAKSRLNDKRLGGGRQMKEGHGSLYMFIIRQIRLPNYFLKLNPLLPSSPPPPTKGPRQLGLERKEKKR